MNKGYLFVLLTALISGVSIFLNKFAIGEINPYVFTFSKNILVVLFLFSALLFFREIVVFRSLKIRQWLKLVAIGFFGGSIPFLLFFKGLSLSSSAVSALIHKSMFVFIAVFAVLFLKEKLNKSFFVAALFLLAGNLLLLKINKFSFGFSDFLIILAVLLWSVEAVISKQALREMPSRVVSFGRMFFGAVFILIFLVFTGQFSPILSLSLSQFSWIFFTSTLLFIYVITWYAGLKLITASSAASILVLGSAVTTALSMVYAGSFTFLDIFGIAAIMCGIFVLGAASYLSSRFRLFLPAKN